LKPLNLLVIADPHYTHHAKGKSDDPAPPGRYTLEWVKRALDEAMRFMQPDALVLLGDVIENGSSDDAEKDITEFAEGIQQLDIPCVAIPGNHDGDPERFLRIFGEHAGAHEVNGHNLYTFVDDRSPEDVTTRSAAALAAFANVSENKPIIAIQHNPVYPQVDCSNWPYMPTNTDEIVSSYERANVVLSLSGHYHKGVDPLAHNGTTYLTCPSIADGPFPFYLITVRGRHVETQRLELALPQTFAPFDAHTHTHFGYCAVDVHPARSSERARLLGLSGLACVEHAGQIYLSAEEFWQQQNVQQPDMIRKARSAGTDRMAQYRAEMATYRSPFLHVGLEVDCDKHGKLNLLDEDREGWDILLGAIHCLPEQFSTDTPGQCVQGFMWTVEKLVTQGINVLAHPFRFLAQHGLPRRAELYRPVAELLSAHGVAAEMNLRHNAADPEFFRICLEHGVRLTLASDAHNQHEVGALQPHLRMLSEVGCPLTACHRDRYNIGFRRIRDSRIQDRVSGGV